MAIQASFVTTIPQVTRSLVSMKLMACAAAVLRSIFLAGGVSQDNPFDSPLPSTITICRPLPTPSSPNYTALHFPWVFVTFFLVTVITTIFLLITSAPASNPPTNFPSSLNAFDRPLHARAQVGHADDKVRGKLVAAKRHLVAHMLGRCLRAILYGVIIRECLPTMAVFFTRWAAPTWMANCAGAVTTLVALAPALLRRCFSYTICIVYLQWPVSSDLPKTSSICPTMSVATSSPVDGQDLRDPEETSNLLPETTTVPETTHTPYDYAPVLQPRVSLINDATEPTQTRTAIQDVMSDDSLGDYIEPQPELERTMASVHPLRDEDAFTAISESVNEETLWVSRELEATFDEPGTIRTITASVIELPSVDNEQQHHSLVESQTEGPSVNSHSPLRAVGSFDEPTFAHYVAEVSGSPDSAQVTSSCPTPFDHVDSLAIPPSSSELVLPDPVQISQSHTVNCLTELPFDGEDMPLIDSLVVQSSLPDTNVLVNSPNSCLVEAELSPFHVSDNPLSTNMPLAGLTLEPISEEGNSSDDMYETPIPIRRTTEHCLVTTYTPDSLRAQSDSNMPPSSGSPVRFSVRFDLPTTSSVTSVGDDPFYVSNVTTTPPPPEDEVVPYNWDIHDTSDDEVDILLPMNLPTIDDDLLKPSTSFTAPPRPSSPLMSIRELDPGYREDEEFMSFFWTTASPEQLARLGGDDDNLLDVYIDLQGYGREPILEPIGSPDDYIALEPSVSMLLDEIFPETSWRDEDDLLNDTDLPDQPDVEDDWVLTEEMRSRIMELKKQFDDRRAASQGELHGTLHPSPSPSPSFNILATPSATVSSPAASSGTIPEFNSGTVSLSPASPSPLQASADTTCTVARPSSPPPMKSSPTMIPRARSRPRSSLMNLTSAPTAARGLGSWR